MDVTPLIAKDRKVIQAYDRGVFKISGQRYDTAICVWPDTVAPWALSSDVSTLDDLIPADFDVFTQNAAVDVVLLGAGAVMAFLPKPLKIALQHRGLNVEVMDTGAACRTYNVLMAEGRRVACALLPHIA